MTIRNRPADRRPGFTLVELLTVVAIISLLIGILLPSLSRARDQAKRLRTAALLSAIDKGLEMFQTDFGHYPDSMFREDPIDWAGYPGDEQPRNKEFLSGAHWLSRAMAGHDMNGMDAAGSIMMDVDQCGDDGQPACPSYDGLKAADRKGLYMEGEIFARDDDVIRFPGGKLGGSGTGRTLIVEDSFASPVLYYRANTRARKPFCIKGKTPGDPLGVYRQEDNERLGLWDFAGTGQTPLHLIEEFGWDISAQGEPRDSLEEDSFAFFLHNPTALKNKTLRPYNADRFILITAGKDGRFGTQDDVTNFKSGL